MNLQYNITHSLVKIWKIQSLLCGCMNKLFITVFVVIPFITLLYQLNDDNKNLHKLYSIFIHLQL